MNNRAIATRVCFAFHWCSKNVFANTGDLAGMLMAVAIMCLSMVLPSVANAQSCQSCAQEFTDYKQAERPELKALFRAARTGDEASFSRLIRENKDFDQFADNRMPLLSALLYPIESLSQESGTQKTWRDFSAEEAERIRKLHLASLPAKKRMIALALKYGASVKNVSLGFQAPPLHLAAVFGDAEIVRLLLKHGADPNQGHVDRQMPPIEFALTDEMFIRMRYLPILVSPGERSKIFIALLAAGAKRPFLRIDEHFERKEGKAPERPVADSLLWPALVEMTEGTAVLDAFVKTGTKPEFDESLSPLARAARAGNVEAVRWLNKMAPRTIVGGAISSERDQEFDTRLTAAIWALYPKVDTADARQRADLILRELLKPGMPWGQSIGLADTSRNRLISRSPSQYSGGILNHLVVQSRREWVKYVVGLGASANGDCQTCVPPLVNALVADDSEMVKLLMSLGADPANDKFGFERSAIYRALVGPQYSSSAPETSKEMIRLLLEGVSPVSLDDGKKALLLAKYLEHSDFDAEVARYLLAKGFPVTAVGIKSMGNAIRHADKQFAHDLLQKGVRLNERSEFIANEVALRYQHPTLMVAIGFRRDDLLLPILQAGGDPNIRDYRGKSAADYAETAGNRAAMDLFQAYEASSNQSGDTANK